MNGEKWVPVKNYEGLYEVSDQGRVRSLDRIITTSHGVQREVPGRQLVPGISRAGYQVVALSKTGKPASRNVHRLVAEAFIPNPANLPLVRHLDDIGSHNRVSNLAWGTYSENRKDAVRSGAYINQYAGISHCKRGHEFSRENTYNMPGGGRSCRTCTRVRYHSRKSK